MELSPPPRIVDKFNATWKDWLWHLYQKVQDNMSRDFYIDVMSGRIAGYSMVHKFGRNNAVPNGSWAHVSSTPFAIANFRESAGTVNVKVGGDAQDTDTTGTGARKIVVQGIDSNFNESSETINLAGASASSATTTTWWRIHRAWVSEAGTYSGANTDDIVIEDVDNNELITIVAGEGQTQYAGFTIPSGKTGYLLSTHVTIDSNKTTNVRCFTRKSIDDVSAPLEPKRLKLYWDGIQAPGYVYRPKGPELSLDEKTDIWFEAYGDGAVSQVSIDFELLLIDN